MYICRSEEHTSELQSHLNLVCRLLLEKNNIDHYRNTIHLHADLPSHRCRRTPRAHRSLTCTRVCASISSTIVSSFCFFFLINTPPPEISPFPLRAAFPF